MSFWSSLSKIWTMCRFAGESASRNTYEPAGSVAPGIETGPLNVTLVLRSALVPCAAATFTVSSVAAHAAVIMDVIRPISNVLLLIAVRRLFGAQGVPLRAHA